MMCNQHDEVITTLSMISDRLDRLEAHNNAHQLKEDERLTRIETRFNRYEGAAGMLILFTSALWAVFVTFKEFIIDRTSNG